MKILLVEDDADLAAAVAEALEDACYAVDTAPGGAQADELMTVYDYDLVVLDWKIPPPSGLELLEAWRQRGIEVPVLMLTGRGGLEDRISGLDTGADDYLTKPFAVAELLARVRSLLRRREKPLHTLEAGDVVMDRAARRVTVAGRPVRLTPKEFGVLEYLLLRSDEAVSRDDLAEHVWDHTFDAMSNTLDVIVYRVRKKIDGGREAKLLHTLPGVGYRLTSRRQDSG
jgi:two-component system copper resistance phosphate regulon response regulator CusR